MTHIQGCHGDSNQQSTLQGYKPDNTTHAGPEGTTSGHNSRRGQEDIFHAYTSTDTPWVAHALSHFTSIRYGRIAFVSAAHDATQFGDFICHVCIRTVKCLFIQTQPTWALIDTGGGYHLEALNIISDHFPSFPFSILYFSLIALPGLILNHSIINSSSQHSFHEPGYQKSLNLVSGVCHSTSTGVLFTKHSITNGFPTTIGAR
jgi:hypothetical protein